MTNTDSLTHRLGRGTKHVVIARYAHVIVRTAHTLPEDADSHACELRQDPNVLNVDVYLDSAFKDRTIVRVFL